MENIRKRTIYVTLDDERDDLSILHQYGRTYLRQVTIQRITEEAIEQDGLLTQEDLSRLLRCSKRTIRRDIRAIQDRGVHVVTRGVFHNVGRCQTHKSQIIRLYLEGFTYSEIHRKCYHTTSSIKRYLEDFKKVLMSLHHGVTDSRNIAQVTGLSVYLVKQYRALISEAKQSPIMQDTLSIMIEQNQYMDGVKKNAKKRWAESGSYGGTMNRNQRDRYESINKRNFRNALIHLLETEYKIIGSRKILSLLADDIEQLHSEYFVSTSTVGIGEIVFRTTADDGQRPELR